MLRHCFFVFCFFFAMGSGQNKSQKKVISVELPIAKEILKRAQPVSTNFRTALSVNSGLIFNFPVDIGYVPIGESRVLTIVVYSNDASVRYPLGNLSISGSSDYSLQNDSCSGANIPGGSRCYFDVVFTPTMRGQQQATFSISFTAYTYNENGVLEGNSGIFNYDITGSTPQNYSIIKTAVDEGDPNRLVVEPSFKKCGRINQSIIKTKKLRLLCMDLDNNIPSAGCSVRLMLELGSDDGGHFLEHTGLRPLQWAERIPINTDLPIPKAGLELVYEAPESSGDVLLSFDAQDPDGDLITVPTSVFNVKISTELERLFNIPGFDFEPATMNSHGSSGQFVSTGMLFAVRSGIEKFREEMSKIFPPDKIPQLESEGASLFDGGLYDVNKNWMSPHCTHRQGTNIDISFSNFRSMGYSRSERALAERILLKAFRRNALSSYTEANHWHFTLQEN